MHGALCAYLVLLSLSLQNSPCIGSGGSDEGYGTRQDISPGFGLVHRGVCEGSLEVYRRSWRVEVGTNCKVDGMASSHFEWSRVFPPINIFP